LAVPHLLRETVSHFTNDPCRRPRLLLRDSRPDDDLASSPADDRASVAVLPLEKWYVTTEMQDHIIDRLRRAGLEIPDAHLTGRSP
jgi:hypothetical protein